MNPHRPEIEFAEPERYELYEGPYYHFELSRREFVQTLGAGLLLSVAIPGLAQRARESRGASLAQRLHLGKDGTITVLTSKVEVGQGSRTQLTQAAAEELRLPLGGVRLLMADTAVVPDDGGTAGSRTTPSSVPTIRRACAAARQLLLDTAAAKFQVEVKDLSVRDGQVVGLKAEQHFAYSDLAAGEHASALEREVAPGVTLSDAKTWSILGTPAPRVDGRAMVTGTHRYPSDIRREGMLYGKVLRPATYGATLESLDLSAVKQISGVTAVHDGDFVGFAAPTSFESEAARALAAESAKWKKPEHPSSDELFDYLQKHTTSQRSRREVKGSPDEAFKDAAKVVRGTYHVAYIQHAPMEPRAAVAEWKAGKLTVWTGSQQPARVQEDLMRAFRLARDSVRVIVPDTGGGFGGKHSGEVAVEAARLAQAAGKPVSVRWTREEEFTWAYFRPAGVMEVAGALGPGGDLLAWEQTNINSGNSAIATPYAVPHSATQFKPCDAPLRSGSYRALASTANAFARESLMDDLAVAAAQDPLEFRLRHLTNERLRGVLLAATERFGWKTAKNSNSGKSRTGVGLACATEKGSYVACCARLEVDEMGRSFKVLELCQAFECGAIQNPANLKAQVEGCILMGLGGALREEMRFKGGQILNPRFSQYLVPRFKDMPQLEIVLVNRPDLPSVGAGETPLIGVAPAIGNAFAQATKTRLKALPMQPVI
jgi:isoquinoline 1-oxidoreductase